MNNMLDQLTRDHTAFLSFTDLINARGNYRPSIDVNPASSGTKDRIILADAYDQAMLTMGYEKRAFRFGTGQRAGW